MRPGVEQLDPGPGTEGSERAEHKSELEHGRRLVEPQRQPTSRVPFERGILNVSDRVRTERPVRRIGRGPPRHIEREGNSPEVESVPGFLAGAVSDDLDRLFL